MGTLGQAQASGRRRACALRAAPPEPADQLVTLVGRRSAAALVVAAGCVLALALTGCGRSAGATASAAVRSGAPSTYTLMQMNLCLSGLAGCYRKVQYPAAVNEAVIRIRGERPDAVTLNEACSGDVALIARRAGYHWRFSTVIYYGKPLMCIRPGGRGLFGDAVVTRAAVQSSSNHAFGAQAGPEQRRWLCPRSTLCDHLRPRQSVCRQGRPQSTLPGQCALCILAMPPYQSHVNQPKRA